MQQSCPTCNWDGGFHDRKIHDALIIPRHLIIRKKGRG